MHENCPMSHDQLECCFSMLIIKVVTWHCTTILVTLKSVKTSANYTQAYKMSFSFEHKANPPRFDKIRLFFKFTICLTLSFQNDLGKIPCPQLKVQSFTVENFYKKYHFIFWVLKEWDVIRN